MGLLDKLEALLTLLPKENIRLNLLDYNKTISKNDLIYDIKKEIKQLEDKVELLEEFIYDQTDLVLDKIKYGDIKNEIRSLEEFTSYLKQEYEFALEELEDE